MKEYTTIPYQQTQVESVIEKSRFLCFATRVDSVEQATQFIQEKKKKYYDASHNCYAYVVDDKAKFSDDGEPQGTAGLPIYECICNNNLNHICVVVTRYFGGVKLGAGGLVRAYSGSCADVLKSCERVNMTDCTRANVTVDYSLLKVVRNALAQCAVIENVLYDQQVTIVCLFPTCLSNTILDIVTQNSLGKAVFAPCQQLLAHFTLTNK